MLHFFSLDRGIIVAASFLLWLGAAGLVCWALVPSSAADASTDSTIAVVKTAKAAAVAMPISLAQR